MELTVGDVFYIKTKDQYYVYKLIELDSLTSIHHVIVYKPFTTVPTGNEFLEVYSNHIPIDTPKEFTFLKNEKVSSEERVGFLEYLKITDFARFLKETNQTIEQVVNTANLHFKNATDAYNLGNFRLAIENYTKAIEVYPLFFEAVDRRAFSKMAMGEYLDAIKDFEFSLLINPNAVVAEFAIGECYFKLNDFQKAVDQFRHTAKLFPEDELTIEWLEKSLEALNN